MLGFKALQRGQQLRQVVVDHATGCDFDGALQTLDGYWLGHARITQTPLPLETATAKSAKVKEMAFNYFAPLPSGRFK
jgi:hypothetical protein